jgi:hypothetical protein
MINMKMKNNMQFHNNYEILIIMIKICIKIDKIIIAMKKGCYVINQFKE